MSNVNFVDPPYFGFLREMIRRAEDHAAHWDRTLLRNRTPERETTNHLYEVEALTNLIGEMECARVECERRIRYLEAKALEDI